jgi:molybdopterin synthase sulfur carrier subunit
MKVRVFGALRHHLGAKAAEVALGPGDTIGGVLTRLSAAHPLLGQRILNEDGGLQTATNVLVNGRNISQLDGLETAVCDGDRVALFPAAGGG